MAVLGILSLLQITLLPGLIVLGVSKYQGSWLRRMCLSFGLSLTANYVAVLGLMAAGLYVRPVVFGIFGAELAAIVWLYGTAIRRWFGSPLLPRMIEPAAAEIRRLRGLSGPDVAGLVRGVAAIASLLVALFQIGRVLVTFAANWGSIFMWVDAVLQWNRYAVEWSHNGPPVNPYHYPQLLPANWSISYVFMNMPLQYIARGMMPLFLIVLLLAMLDMGWTRKTAGPYLATVVAAYLYSHCGINLTEGGADLPVSCLAFLSFSCVVAAERESVAGSRTWYLLMGAVLAAGAAVTKQTGLYFLTIYPVLAYVFVLSDRPRAGLGQALRLGAVYLAIALVIVVPFYVYAEMQIRAGLWTSELAYVTNGIYGGVPVSGRIVNAWRMFVGNVGPVPTLLMVVLSIVAVGDRLSRWVSGLIVVPWALMWAGLASYDGRNLALAIPFIALSVGTGAAAVLGTVTVSPLHHVKTGLRRVAALPAWVFVTFAAAMIAAGIGFGLEPTTDRMVAHQRRLERELGNAALNAQLYAQYDRQPFSGRIATNYAYLLHLPDLDDLGVFENFGVGPESIEFAQYRKNFEDPSIAYFLLPVDAYPSTMRDVEERLQRGEFRLLFRAEGYLFVEIVRR